MLRALAIIVSPGHGPFQNLPDPPVRQRLMANMRGAAIDKNSGMGRISYV
jgi:hypothetical protein